MSINYEELLKKEAFSALNDEQKNAYVNLAQNLSGKNMSESMPILMEFMKNIPQGRPLSKDEQKAMQNAIVTSLPAEEAAKFQNIIKVLSLMK